MQILKLCVPANECRITKFRTKKTKAKPFNNPVLIPGGGAAKTSKLIPSRSNARKVKTNNLDLDSCIFYMFNVSEKFSITKGHFHAKKLKNKNIKISFVFSRISFINFIGSVLPWNLKFWIFKSYISVLGTKTHIIRHKACGSLKKL